MKNWKNLEKELLKNPKVKAEVEKLEPEYQLARQLIKARLAKKLTQDELAKKVGVKQEYIARLESGQANPTLETINKVGRALDKKLKLVGSN